jgi:hypothetical protein
MAVTLHDRVAALAGPANWESGRQLYRDRAVLDARVSGRGMEARLASDRGFVEVTLSFRQRRLTSRCTCTDHVGLCKHAVACLLLAEENPETIAFLQPAASAIPDQQAAPAAAPEAPPAPPSAFDCLRNPGLTFESMRRLLQAEAPDCSLSLHSETAIGTMESQWNRLTLTAQLHRGETAYAQGNVRRLIETGRGAGHMTLDDFAPQEQQIMRFLVAHAEFGTTAIHIGAHVLADLFHALGGFSAFYVPDGRLHVHAERIETVFEAEGREGGAHIRPRLLLPGHGHLPPSRPTYIAGRAGYWIGFGTEYWWLPGFFPSAWLQLFLHARGLDLSDRELARLQDLCAVHRIQSRLVPSNQHGELAARQGRCRPVLTLDWDHRGIQARIEFDYAGRRVGTGGPIIIWGSNRFVCRDHASETHYVGRVRAFGFQRFQGQRDRFLLDDPEAMWEFAKRHLPHLENEWELYWTPRFSTRLQAAHDLRVVIRAGSEGDSWFETRCELLDASGRPVAWQDLAEAVRARRSLIALPDGTLVHLPGDVLRVLRVFEQRGKTRDGGKTFRFGLHAAIPLADPAAGFWEGGEAAWQRLRLRLADASAVAQRPVPAALWPRLRSYQREGVRWLQVLEECGFHGILADEMGLGKTVQALAAIAARALQGPHGPSMIVCPTSLVENWLMEAARFTPELSCVAIRGGDRPSLIEHIRDYDLIITSYSLLRRDIAEYESTEFDYLVLDEAQHIKNPHTANARTCKELLARHRLVLTGTPLENSLAEIWSLFDFLLPGYLGTHRDFRQSYEARAAAGDPAAVTQDLRPILHPFILRRTKRDVCAELPPKLEQVLYCEMADEQRRLYETLLAAGRQMLAAARLADWPQHSAEILTLLLRLRQACCHPGLLPADLLLPGQGPLPSAKLELAREVILEAIDSGHRILLFSQFTGVLALFPEWLTSCAIPFEYMDGSTPDRQARVDRFNRDGSIPIFLLSLKAGGTGLNLTGADTVIHYDQWWNPMVEDQATDRTHRIGQAHTVTALKLVTRHTIEERILQLQAAKRDIFNRLLEGVPGGLAALTPEDVAFLLEPGE